MNLKSTILAVSLASPLAAQSPPCSPQRFAVLAPYFSVDSVIPTVSGPSASLYSLASPARADPLKQSLLLKIDSIDADTLYRKRLHAFYDSAGSQARSQIEREFSVSSRRPLVRVSARFLHDTIASTGKNSLEQLQQIVSGSFAAVYFPRGPFHATGIIAPNPAVKNSQKTSTVVHEYVHALAEDILWSAGLPSEKHPKDPFFTEGIAEYLSKRAVTGLTNTELARRFSQDFVFQHSRPDFLRRRYSLAPAYLAALVDSLESKNHPQPVHEALRRFALSPPCTESHFTPLTGQVR